MVVKEFKEKELRKLHQPQGDSTKEDNGQVTIIGGSKLFHGSPIFSLKVASRIVDMVFFASPEPSVGRVAERIKSKLNSFIWVPFEEVGEYIKKSDAILIGPGLMRYRKEDSSIKYQVSKKMDKEGEKSKRITETLLKKFPDKQWVIDAGSLQVMEAKHIPQNAILTPNKREFEILFGVKASSDTVLEMAKRHQCFIISKDVSAFICSPKKCLVVEGGNAGLSKGGTGDVLAGLIWALVAKNPPFWAACAGSYLAKKAADELYQKVGFAYNADDLAEKIPRVLGKYWK